MIIKFFLFINNISKYYVNLLYQIKVIISSKFIYYIFNRNTRITLKKSKIYYINPKILYLL